jgi:LysM repeat protein
LGAIASRFGVTLDGIVALNPSVSDSDLIQPSQVLMMM